MAWIATCALRVLDSSLCGVDFSTVVVRLPGRAGAATVTHEWTQAVHAAALGDSRTLGSFGRMITFRVCSNADFDVVTRQSSQSGMFILRLDGS